LFFSLNYVTKQYFERFRKPKKCVKIAVKTDGRFESVTFNWITISLRRKGPCFFSA